MAVTVRQVTRGYGIVISFLLLVACATIISKTIGEKYCQVGLGIATVSTLGIFTVEVLFICANFCGFCSNVNMEIPKAYLAKSITYTILGGSVIGSYFADQSCWWLILIGVLQVVAGLSYGLTAYFENIKINEQKEINKSLVHP